MVNVNTEKQCEIHFSSGELSTFHRDGCGLSCTLIPGKGGQLEQNFSNNINDALKNILQLKTCSIKNSVIVILLSVVAYLQSLSESLMLASHYTDVVAEVCMAWVD